MSGGEAGEVQRWGATGMQCALCALEVFRVWAMDVAREMADVEARMATARDLRMKYDASSGGSAVAEERST